jgi:hypothetical protein
MLGCPVPAVESFCSPTATNPSFFRDRPSKIAIAAMMAQLIVKIEINDQMLRDLDLHILSV